MPEKAHLNLKTKTKKIKLLHNLGSARFVETCYLHRSYAANLLAMYSQLMQVNYSSHRNDYSLNLELKTLLLICSQNHMPQIH